MTIIEKADKALDFLKNHENTAKSHELQNAAGNVGRCLGALGNKSNLSHNFTNLFNRALPTLLSLASNNSADVRLLGDEALNRTVVGGSTFHASKINAILLSSLDVDKNARWNRAIISRIYIGDVWLRPGPGKLRSQVQMLLPKLVRIINSGKEMQLIMESLELNLARILDAIAEYLTDDDAFELVKAFFGHIDSEQAPVRRGAAYCVGLLCKHYHFVIGNLLNRAIDALWPESLDVNSITGWFGTLKSFFQHNSLEKIKDSGHFNVTDFLEIYQLSIHYLELPHSDHNIQNAVMECLQLMLTQCCHQYKAAMLDLNPVYVEIGAKMRNRKHSRCISSLSMTAQSIKSFSSLQSDDVSNDASFGDMTEDLTFSGGLHLGSLSELQTPIRSSEDLSLIQTPDSPTCDSLMDTTDHYTKQLTENVDEINPDFNLESTPLSPVSETPVDQFSKYKRINIGSSYDNEIRLKYCFRLIASKFLLTGHSGEIISDRMARVSLKANALHCIAAMLLHYPELITMFLNKDVELNVQDLSAITSASNLETSNQYILERNVCFQESITDSFSRELLNKSIESKIDKSTSSKIEIIKSIGDSSSKDIPSNILDTKTNLGASVDSTIPNMTNSNFTNMTISNDLVSSGYPMTSSADLLTHSIDPKIDLNDFVKTPLKRTDMKADKIDYAVTDEKNDYVARDANIDSAVRDENIDSAVRDGNIDFKDQHTSEIFTLLGNHNDPQIRGLLRVAIFNYLRVVLDLTHGNYGKWKNLEFVPIDCYDNLKLDGLIGTLLKGLEDEAQSSVNYTLNVLGNLIYSLTLSVHRDVIDEILNSLISIETNKYWLCKVNLCKLYEGLPYNRLAISCSSYKVRSANIMEILIRLLSDNDHKVRNAASKAITEIAPHIYMEANSNETVQITKIANKIKKHTIMKNYTPVLNRTKQNYYLNDLPEPLKHGKSVESLDNLKIVISDLVLRYMSTGCKHFLQGLLETIHSLATKYLPWNNLSCYMDQGILELALDKLHNCSNSVASCCMLIDLCALLYPVEIFKCMRDRPSLETVKEPSISPVNDKWVHIESERTSKLAEKYTLITLKMLNIIVHLVEDINLNVYNSKSSIPLPGSPVRKKSQQDSLPRRSKTTLDEERIRRRPLSVTHNMRANFVGHFVNDNFYVKLYENLKSAYSNHKVNIDQKSSIFHQFVTSALNSLAVLLELGSEAEFSPLTEEILYYLKCILPFKIDKSIFCVTQLLKCIFGINMAAQFEIYMTLFEFEPYTLDKTVDNLESIFFDKDVDFKRMEKERLLLKRLESFNKNKSDKRWANKKDLEINMKLFEPVVLQGLRSYTRQHDLKLQCEVLRLLRQLLALRINYCRLDSEQVFVGFVLTQLEIIEQGEIPNSCELVHGIVNFLVQVSSSKYNSKQIIEIPKIIQLCDGLLASGCHSEAIVGLGPLVLQGFLANEGFLAKSLDAQVTREVLFYMLQKTMNNYHVINLISTVLCLTQENRDTYNTLSEKALDTLLSNLFQLAVDLNSNEAVYAVENLLDVVPEDVLMEQGRIEMCFKIMFMAPPDQISSPVETKERYMATLLIIIRKILTKIPETDILSTINLLKLKHVSPKSIFFNAKSNVDPLLVNTHNDDCANLEPNVILVRFFFRLLTFAVSELDTMCERDMLKLEDSKKEKDGYSWFIYNLVINLVEVSKNVFHTFESCKFPETSKTAEELIQNEQSNLNTGLYSPEENIPLSKLNRIVLKYSYRLPLLTVHWSQMSLRLKLLDQHYWKCILGHMRKSPLSDSSVDVFELNLLQTGCALALCEYFVENGLSDAIFLSWLLVNRIQLLITLIREPIVTQFFEVIHQNCSASGLLLQAVAARCQGLISGEFATKTFETIKNSHANQSGVLVFLICRIIGKMELAVGRKFADLANSRLTRLAKLPIELLVRQLSKDDVSVAFELLRREKSHIRYPSLLANLNALATCALDMSPLDLSNERSVNPQNILTTIVSEDWLVNQIKLRCCLAVNNKTSAIAKRNELAQALSKLNSGQLNVIFNSQEFDRRILSHCFQVSCDVFLREFIKDFNVYESVEFDREITRQTKCQVSLPIEEPLTVKENNILQVASNFVKFKKSDSKESIKQSQFFVPMTDEPKFGELKIELEPNILNAPEINELYLTSVASFDKSLAAFVKSFPKPSRPLSQSQDFVLNLEYIANKYTRCCHQYFSSKLFQCEYSTMHTVLEGLLKAFIRVKRFLDPIDCVDSRDVLRNILPDSLTKNIAIFSVISLQYLTFLIKNKSDMESPDNIDVSFRGDDSNLEQVVVDHIMAFTLKNVSMALNVNDIWNNLNLEGNVTRVISAVGCLYGILKHFVKDTKPLILRDYFRQHCSSTSDEFPFACDKLLSMIEYFDSHIYSRNTVQNESLLPLYARDTIEKILKNLSRLHILNTIALIPPMAWPKMEVNWKDGQMPNIGLPLHVFQDSDILEAFLLRVNFIGWSSKKIFEEIWTGLLFALQGNGTHWAVKGIMQLLLSAAKTNTNTNGENTLTHCPRSFNRDCHGMQILRSLIVGEDCESLFENVDMERIPFLNEKRYDFEYSYGQYSVEYLRYAAGITTDVSFHVRTIHKKNMESLEVDLKSCLQLLMDMATEMLLPKSETGVSAKCNLISCLVSISDIFTDVNEWIWLSRHLISLTGTEYTNLTQYSIVGQYLLYGLARATAVLNGIEGVGDTSIVHQKLLKSLASSHAPLKMAALHGCLLLVHSKSYLNVDTLLVDQLVANIAQYLGASNRISLYEQSLYWTLFFTIVELGNFDLMNKAIDVILKNPRNFCIDLVVKGVCAMIRNSVLPKDLKKNIIGRMLNEKKKYSEQHSTQLLMVHLFSADDKLISPRLTPNVSNMDPDVLMSSMERLTLLYKTLRECEDSDNQRICAIALKHLLRETLPPMATLSRVVIEFLECCKDTEKRECGLFSDRCKWMERTALNAEIVFEVFETAVTQNQLPTLIGWIFEALTHLLSGKISKSLVPFCLLNLLLSASPNENIRNLSPTAMTSLKSGLNLEQNLKSEFDSAGNAFDFDSSNKMAAETEDYRKYAEINGECSKNLPVKGNISSKLSNYCMSFAERRLLCTIALHSEFSYEQLLKLKELCVMNGCLNDLSRCLNEALR